jgi:hypothetical protein
MKTLHYLLIIISVHAFINLSFAQQGQSAVPFILISPSTDANGMGETSVALISDDPFGSYRNPAVLGCQSLGSYFSFSKNWNSWLPNLSSSRDYGTLSFSGGADLSKISPRLPHLSLGVAYSHISMDLGESERRDENNTDLGTFSSDEAADQISISSAIDSWVIFSAGVSFKWISSDLYPIASSWYTGRKGTTNVSATDFGFFLNIPTIDISSRLLDRPLEFAPNYKPFFDVSLGTSWTNIGDKVIYIQTSQADPLPRTVHNGIGFNLGVSSEAGDHAFNLFSLRYTIEVSDLLVRWNPIDTIRDSEGAIISISDPSWQYQSGFGDLHYFNDLILGESNPSAEKRKGWELNLCEVLFIRGGSVEGASDHRYVKTTGFSVHPLRLLNLWPRFVSDEETINVGSYIFMHLDIWYSHSYWNTPNNSFHPLDGTTFDALNISFNQ